MLTKEQIKILEESLELLMDYPDVLDRRTVNDRWFCAICNGLIGVGGHFEKCRLISIQTQLDNLIEELKKND